MKYLEKIAIDFMAEGAAHSLYHIGFERQNCKCKIYLEKNSEIFNAAKAYKIKFQNSNIILQSKIDRIITLFNALFFQKIKIEILGVHLRHAIFIFLLSIFSKERINIHMHGQVHALRRLSFKYLLWKIISKKCNLLVANPAYRGPNFVSIINNLHHIVDLKSEDNNKVKVGTVREKNELNLENIKYKIKNIVNASYGDYVKLNLGCNYTMICFDDDYYEYSPSGRISDAKNFSQIVLILAPSQDLQKMAISICKAYKVDYETVKY